MVDYAGAKNLHRSDGKSLRRFIARNYNQVYEERYAVAELDQRRPVSETKFSGSLGRAPNFSIRKGQYKLIMTKKANAKIQDMLYDLKNDPYEERVRAGRWELFSIWPCDCFSDTLLLFPTASKIQNKIGDIGMKAPASIIGKAEHLRALLVEYMER